MAWNQPGYSNRNRANAKKRPPNRFGVVCFCAAIIIAIVASIFLLCDSKSPSDGNEISEKPQRQKPASKQRPKVPQHNLGSKVEVDDIPNTPSSADQKPTTTVGMSVTNAYGQVYLIKREIKHDFAFRQNGVEYVDRPISEHQCDNDIDALLCVRPGDRVLATFNPDALRDSLSKHMHDPIPVEDDDTEYIKERKLAVMEAKKDLLAAMQRGEDPVEIIIQDRKELTRIANIRDNILNAVAEVRRTAETEEEVNSYIAAANQMLEPLGCPHIYTHEESRNRLEQAAKLRKLNIKVGK
jgi:hypothetical protein